MSLMTISTACARTLKTPYACRNITWARGSNMPSGKPALVNSGERVRFLKELLPSILSMSPFGSSMQTWRCVTNSWTQQEMFGSALANICPGSTSSGTNMLLWRKCSAKLSAPDVFSKTGWLGSLQSTLGMPLSSLSNDVVRSIIVVTSWNDLSMRIQWLPASWRQQISKSIRETIVMLVYFSNAPSQSLVNEHSMNSSSSTLQSSRLDNANTTGPRSSLNMHWRTFLKKIAEL